MNTRLEKYAENRQNWVYSFIHELPTKTVMIISLHVLFLLITIWIEGIDYQGQVALFAFLSAMTLWIATKVSAGYVAVALLVFIVIMKAASTELLYSSLSEEVVWLMIGSFIMGEAVKQSGLAERLSKIIMKRSRKKGHVLTGISSVLFTSALFIPSTSGRAALSMPILQQLSQTFSDKEKSVLAVMAPVIILMSTSATLIGAGSHVIGVGLLESTTNQTISYLQWMIWGLPFSFIITVLTFVTIKKMLWKEEEKEPKKHQLDIQQEETTPPLNQKEKKTLVLLSILMVGWLTESIHGYDTAFITIIGAMLIMLPHYGVLSWKSGVKSVSWNLILFVAAATALGKVLVDTGVVGWLEKGMFSRLNAFGQPSEWFTVLLILLVTVTSHLYITSHTTRAIVFIPSLLVFSESIGADPVSVVFLSLIGMNYCITFPVSSKALLLFYEDEKFSYDSKQLIKISAVLMPVYIIITMIFYFTIWNWTGMDLYVR